jgi:hypothetical protein
LPKVPAAVLLKVPLQGFAEGFPDGIAKGSYSGVEVS